MSNKSDEQEYVERQGVTAFREGKGEKDCPFPSRGETSSLRVWWFNGYFAASSAKKFPKWFSLSELLANTPGSISKVASLLMCLVLFSGCTFSPNGVSIDWPKWNTTPIVKPVEPVQPVAHEFRCLIIEDVQARAKLPKSQVNMLTSKNVRDFLKANCVKDSKGNPQFRFVDNNTKLTGVWQDMLTHGGQLTTLPIAYPQLILQNGDRFLYRTLPTDWAELKSVLEEYAGVAPEPEPAPLFKPPKKPTSSDGDQPEKPKQKPAIAPKRSAVANHVGQHSHTCPKCGMRWWHGAEAANNPRAHNCPHCGTQQFEIDGDSSGGRVFQSMRRNRRRWAT